jgi:glucosamine--fructose-6-phosphate aminotransferase (isomerizing)
MKGERGFFVRKKIGNIDLMEKNLIGYECQENVGAVHLRWATHGEIEEKNIHPFFDCAGDFLVMHKGIIENYKELKKELELLGHVFRSDTDTEVLVHSLERYYKGDFGQAVRDTLKEVKGTYALIFLSKHSDEMIVANAGMGMILGIGDGEYWVGADKKLIYPFTDRVVYLNDEEMMIVNKNGFLSSMIAGGNINVLSKTIEKIDGKSHSMSDLANIEREIFEHPEMVKNTLAGRIDKQQLTAHFGGLMEYKEFLRNVKSLTFVGSGSSYYTAVIAKKFIEDYAAIAVNSYSGLEMRYKKYITVGDEGALFIVSQSGLTDDTLAALREAKQLGINVFGITNTVGSVLAKETTAGIYLHSGPSLSAMSIRSFMSQLVAMVLLTLFIGRLKGLSPSSGREIINALESLPAKMKELLNSALKIENIARKYSRYSNMVIVGFKYASVIGDQIALAADSLSHMEIDNYDLNYLKYGGIEHLDKNHIVLYLLQNDSAYEENLVMLSLLKKNGAKIILFTFNDAPDINGKYDDVIFMPRIKELVAPLLTLMAMQMFVYYFYKIKTDTLTSYDYGELANYDYDENALSDFSSLI